jgi:hypothetical protein
MLPGSKESEIFLKEPCAVCCRVEGARRNSNPQRSMGIDDVITGYAISTFIWVITTASFHTLSNSLNKP